MYEIRSERRLHTLLFVSKDTKKKIIVERQHI